MDFATLGLGTTGAARSLWSEDSPTQADQIGADSTSTRQRLAGDVRVTVAGIAEDEDNDSIRQTSPNNSEEIDDSDAIHILMDNNNESSVDIPVTEVEESEGPSTTENQRPRPKLTASNSGADIMLGLETEEGQSAEVEIDTADQEELMPEAEVPKGRVRKASITEKVIKSKASEAMAALIKEEAEMRQREFEKLLDEHAELVQEISRTPSSENLIQGERDH
ncbi:hypothetical protein C0Q70_14200 [Pomacea canaliculata]|uniref:Uncharacterized protein n=1 Tax=Pomacea canaliculata TaxID=400727 RepID=A0A2T7NZF5_POMCA|nr:hypothetical protein C0Q70_14200 [Pomacea canaliculata]